MIISVLNAQTFFIATNMSRYYLVETEDSVESEESEEKTSPDSKDYAFTEDSLRPDWFGILVRRAETVVFFYHPDFCHCQYLLDEWEKLSRNKYAYDEFINMEKVNCKKWPQLCEYEGIDQFPVIWRYRFGF